MWAKAAHAAELMSWPILDERAQVIKVAVPRRLPFFQAESLPKPFLKPSLKQQSSGQVTSVRGHPRVVIRKG
jgi:hypothetical protein